MVKPSISELEKKKIFYKPVLPDLREMRVGQNMKPGDFKALKRASLKKKRTSKEYILAKSPISK